MKKNTPNNKPKNTPEGYGRWGKIGVKVISTPNSEPKKKER
jgi:hypothetical protein